MVEYLPKGHSHLSNQLQRVALSISLNIAEGAGEFSSAEKARFYRIARRSTTECASIIDICRCLKLSDLTKVVTR
ncbi:four helix bundle protein [Candidatus Uabimicrobium sp. HlEnr_7]|uniref:four helix bundle protein n=1 Tax=Candidatus Uabimicrobium helgolandensis TaxID=3095367 RepID=UPI003557D897